MKHIYTNIVNRDLGSKIKEATKCNVVKVLTKTSTKICSGFVSDWGFSFKVVREVEKTLGTLQIQFFT